MGRLPAPGQHAYEALQLARYEQGQYFLSHEDGFPPALAAENGFQRAATLLLYLNDVPQVCEGGCLGVVVCGWCVRGVWVVPRCWA